MLTERGKLIGPLPERRILVTGAPRSATTFVGNVLSLPLSVDYLHEPLNPLCGIPSADQSFLDLRGLTGQRRLQVFGEVDALLRYEPMLRTGYFSRDPLAVRLVKPLVGSRGPVYLRLARCNPFSRAVVVKDPFAAMSIEAFVDQWGFQAVALVRHPVAFVASMARLGWEPSLVLADLASQPSVLERLHDEDRALIEQPLLDEWDAGALLWRITTREFLRVAGRRASLVLLTHEAVSNHPIEVFQRLYEDFGLPWSGRIERRIQHMTTGDAVEASHNRTQSFTRDSRKLLELRLDQADASVRQRIWDITGEVASAWYEPEGVRPEAARGLLAADGAPSTSVVATPATAHHQPRVRLVGPAGRTNSLTDQMVLDSCRRWLAHVLAEPADAAEPDPHAAVTLVLGGTIGPSGDLGPRRGWVPSAALGFRHSHVLMGVGLREADGRGSGPRARAAGLGLSRHYLHAVRDEATRQRLAQLGVGNAVVTGCPTTWDVDPARVPTGPARRAVVALNHDLDDEHFVSSLISKVDSHYEHAVLVALHPRDRRFLPLLPRHWEVLPTRLETLDDVLAAGDVDVVGTSGHTAVRALAHGVRALLVDGDPTLGSLVAPLGLPLFDRRDLQGLQAALGGSVELHVERPAAAIEEWLGQFLWAGSPVAPPPPLGADRHAPATAVDGPR